MDRISVEEIVRAVNGTLVRKCEEDHITGVKHDSRECQPGDMFVAVKGENQDGHRYIRRWSQHGAVQSGFHTGKAGTERSVPRLAT